MNDKSSLAPFPIKWSTINHMVDSLGSVSRCCGWDSGLLPFPETSPLPVWSCPSFQRIRVCEAENPSTVVSLRMGNFIFFMLHQILSEQQREGLCFPPREGAKDRSPSLFIAGRHRGPVCLHVVTLIPGPPMVPVITTLWTALFVLRYYMQRDSITCTSLSHRDRAPSEPVLGAQHPFVKWINVRVDA